MTSPLRKHKRADLNRCVPASLDSPRVYILVWSHLRSGTDESEQRRLMQGMRRVCSTWRRIVGESIDWLLDLMLYESDHFYDALVDTLAHI